ncbi:MAG TPA: hypothetical protein VLW85_19785 [Myxococcales bacterium]|nr:hypothetical protein [Myxococcales bacterium]
MNLRALLLAAAASTACTLSVPGQFPCPTPGSTAGCGTGQICGPDKLCTDSTAQCASTEGRCNGVCVDVVSNREHCGDCATVCGPSQQCSNGKCTDFCAPGQTVCPQTAGGFLCENLSNDRNNCGTCGNTCPQGLVCTPGTGGGPGHCAIECVPGLTDCSGNCIDTSSDPAHCGADPTTCAGGSVCGSGQVCVSGHCTLACPSGSVLCGGTCVDPQTDDAHCGGCPGTACAGGTSCQGGQCLTTCGKNAANFPLAKCGSACVDTTADPGNCGGCGNVCAAGAACTNHGAGGAGVCELQCPAGQTPLCSVPGWNALTNYVAGNQVVNGANLYQCVTDGKSAASGGPSGTGSGIADGSVVWKQVSAAPAGPTQCVNLSTDNNNCGACNDVSNSRSCTGGKVCLDGACVVSSCATGLTNCGGACVDTHNDPANCGVCGTSCSAAGSAGPVCANGSCATLCPAGETNCGGKCVDTSSDPAHCHADPVTCTGGSVCAPGETCASGGCTPTCPAGSILCSNKCVDPLHDNNNCGSCANPCGPGLVCSAGTCAGTCGPGLQTCNPGTGSAYCAAFSSDVSNCNGCGKACSPSGSGSPGYPNATAFCASGCGAICSGHFADCDGILSNGCEVDLSQDAAHCGTCSNACPAADNASPACANASCGTSCKAGFADCDLDPATGCEADKAHDAANCGGCGTSCQGTSPYCSGGCVSLAGAGGVQQNLVNAPAEWGAPCFSESYAHVGTTLAAIQAACPPLTGQVMIACAAPGSGTLLAAAFGSRASVFGGGGTDPVFYIPGTGVPAFGFVPGGRAPSFSVASTSYSFDVGATSIDQFTGGGGSQRLSWPVAGGIVTAGGRCGDRVGSAATSNYLRLVFTK